MTPGRAVDDADSPARCSSAATLSLTAFAGSRLPACCIDAASPASSWPPSKPGAKRQKRSGAPTT